MIWVGKLRRKPAEIKAQLPEAPFPVSVSLTDPWRPLHTYKRRTPWARAVCSRGPGAGPGLGKEVVKPETRLPWPRQTAEADSHCDLVLRAAAGTGTRSSLPCRAPPVASHPRSAEGGLLLLSRCQPFKATGRGWSSGPWLEASMCSRCGGGPAGRAGVGRARAAAGCLEGIWAANERGI